MKHNLTKRALSLLLAILLVVGMVPVTALAEPAKGPQLAEGNHILWLDRLASSDYDHFADWLDLYTLIYPDRYSDTLLHNGDYSYLLRQYTGTASFTYDSDPDAAAQAAADAAIAASGNDDLATVTEYASAIYNAWLMDNIEDFALTGEMQVGEERSYEVSCDAGTGTVSYTQSFYFYIRKADGSFDVCLEKYQDITLNNQLMENIVFLMLDTLCKDYSNSATPYEHLVELHRFVLERNEYNTSKDLSAIDPDCRSWIGGIYGSTGESGLVCEGYAKTFVLLVSAFLNLPTVLVTGLANGQPHMWVNIQMADGNWYAVDPTWNDPAGGEPGAVSGLENMKYFLVGSDTVIDGVPFSQSHIVTNIVTDSGLGLTNGPELSKESYTVKPEDIVETTVYINGQDVRDMDAGDDTISWNEETKTLTLNNANILAANGTHKGSGIYVVGRDTVVLELKGDNTVEGLYEEGKRVFCSAAISTVSDLIIRGDGTLTATDLQSPNLLSEYSAGIFSGGNLSIEGGTIHSSSQQTGWRAIGLACGDWDTIGTLSISGGTVYAAAERHGTYAFGNANISGGVFHSVATDRYSSGLTCTKFVLYGGKQGTLFVSGGEITLQGKYYTLEGILDISENYNYCWQNAADGQLKYGPLGSYSGQINQYMHIQPSDYGVTQPSEDNSFSAEAQYRSDGIWGTLPEDLSVTYQWFTPTHTPITDQNVLSVQGGAVYDAQSQLWSFAPQDEEAGMVILNVKVGDVITYTLHNKDFSTLYVTVLGNILFDEVAPGVYRYTATQDLLDLTDGLIAVAVSGNVTSQGTLTLSSLEEVQTDSEHPHIFLSENAGTYMGRVTLSKDGEVVATRDTNYFDYTFTGWKNVYGEGGVVLGTQYFYRHEAQYTGWTEIDGQWYYLDPETGFRTEGIARLPYPTEPINGITYGPNAEDVAYIENKGQTFIDKDTALFVFDENGVFQSNVTGLTGDNRWMVNGQISWHPGLAQVGQDYYYFIGDAELGGNKIATGDVYVSRNTTDRNFVIGGVYTFGADGKMCMYNGITEVNGVLRYYENARLMMGNGLTKVSENYIYVNSNGELLVDAEYYINANDLGIATGLYYFDENGFLVDPLSSEKNGVYFEKGAWYYYENGKIGYSKGLMAYGDGYIYVRSSGKLATGTYYVTNVPAELSDLFRMGQKVIFDDNGIANAPKTGIYEVDGKLYYLVRDQIQYNAGLIEIGGKWVYVRSNGQLATGMYWITNTNGAMEDGFYEFGADGYLIVSDGEDGIVAEGENLYYYLDGKKQFGIGLVQLEDGSYIYVRTNGELAVGSYWITNHNGLLVEGVYEFSEDGSLFA